MATRIQQIVSITLDAGAVGSVAHNLNIRGTPVIPDVIRRDNMGFAGIAATSTSITVRNDTAAGATLLLYLRYYHTEDRVYGNSAVTQLTPAPFWTGGAASIVVTAGTAIPQKLITAKFDSGDLATGIANDAARAMFLGFAWDDFAVAHNFRVSWRVATAGVAVTWGEVALATAAAFSAGSTPVNLTPVGFVDVAADMVAAAPANYTSVVPLTNAITKGQALYGIFAAANTNTAPNITGGSLDALATGVQLLNTDAGWRPSLQLGVASAFAIDAADPVPKQVWSA